MMRGEKDRKKKLNHVSFAAKSNQCFYTPSPLLDLDSHQQSFQREGFVQAIQSRKWKYLSVAICKTKPKDQFLDRVNV